MLVVINVVDVNVVGIVEVDMVGVVEVDVVSIVEVDAIGIVDVDMEDEVDVVDMDVVVCFRKYILKPPTNKITTAIITINIIVNFVILVPMLCFQRSN